MKLKHAIFLLLVVFTTAFFSGCTSVESKSSEEEVVFGDVTKKSNDEIIITNADIKDENAQITTTQATSELPKRVLSDKSEIVTLIDGYGNKTETRYFPGNTLIRYVTVRTSVDGVAEVTVYAANGSAKIVPGLGANTLNASSESIAGAAQITSTGSSPVLRNYMKIRKVEAQTPLQPLPSSAFQQQPTAQSTQPVEPAQPQSSAESESPAQPQNNPEEN